MHEDGSNKLFTLTPGADHQLTIMPKYQAMAHGLCALTGASSQMSDIALSEGRQPFEEDQVSCWYFRYKCGYTYSILALVIFVDKSYQRSVAQYRQ
jgi:hypothetical protein